MKKIKEKDLRQAKKEREELAQKELEITELKIANEILMMAIIELDSQREADKTEMQLAIIELIENGGI